jgi:hypothetical protein
MLTNIFVYQDVQKHEPTDEKEIQDQCLPLHDTCLPLFYTVLFLLSSIPQV